MKKKWYSRIGAGLLLAALSVFPAHAAEWAGQLETVTESRIAGWALDEEAPDSSVTVELTLAGEKGPGDFSVITLTADKVRPELKSVYDSVSHGFSCSVNWEAYEGSSFIVTAAVVSGEERIPLDGSFTYQKGNEEGSPNQDEEAAKEASGSEGIYAKGTVIAEGGPGYETAAPAPETAAGPSSSGSEKEKVQASSESGVRGELLGSFIASGYCSCSRCSGGHNLTYSGTVPQAEHTIAADLEHYPLGTRLMIGDVIYTVEDMGSGVEGNRVDIFFATHEEALAFGLQTVDVYAVN